jgi:S1-C subfamily serine protease
MMRVEDRKRTQERRLALMLLSAASLIAPVLMGVAGDAQAFSAANVYRNTSSSVVLIFGFSDSDSGRSGTGSILTSDGLVLTNDHVVANPETGRVFPNLVIYFKPTPISGDNRKDLTKPFLVDVIARDSELDLALLRIKDPPSGLRPVEVGDSEEVEIGESVAAIGHPGGGGLWTLTTGTISSKRRDHARDVFQTDAAINPGNSGGPLFDEYGRLVGVNTFVRRVNDEGLPLEGLNYSLRSSLALSWVNRQGIVRVSAVSRAAIPVTAPTATPTATPAPTPRVEPVAPPSVAPIAEPTSRPDDAAPRVEPVHAPDPIPQLQQKMAPPPPSDPGVREFEGPHGETMYGVPNPAIDLDDALIQARKGYEMLIERADESIQEMDRLIDDYDNF